jgi:thioredoxin reductase (NADPH)
MYDCIVVGGGPAGLSSAIYLTRFNRKTLVIDSHYGRSLYHQVNENYLGFPKGIHANKLRELGKKQAQCFGTSCVEECVEEIEKKADFFNVRTNEKIYQSKSLIFASGVTDKFPLFDDAEKCIGKSLFWCITCDGYKTKNKRVVVIGRDNEAAVTTMQFLNYTHKLTFVTNGEQDQVSIEEKYLHRLQKANITYMCGSIKDIVANNGKIKKIIMEDGTELVADFLFSMQGAVPNSYTAQQIGVKVNKDQYIEVDLEQRTNIPFVYAAGDVTNHFSHQIATAVHEGSMAAQAANYDLYPPDLKD